MALEQIAGVAAAGSRTVTGLPAVRTAAAPAPPLPDSAAGWQAMFDAIHGGSWSGGDGAHSALLPDGRDLIVFGDTFGDSVTPAGARSADPAFFPNSIAVAAGKHITWTNPPGRPAIPAAPDGSVYWPEAVVTTAGGVQVFANRVRRIGTAVSGIHVAGQSLITFSLDTLALRSVTALTAAHYRQNGNGIWWSAGAVMSGSFVYVYGVQLEHVGDYGRSVYVARAPAAAMADTARWRFWDGSRWTPDADLPPAARLICQEADTVVTVWRAGTTWHLVSQKYGMLGRDIELWTAPRPHGPWRDTTTLYTIPDSEHPDAMFYEGCAHPEVPLASGKLLLSYSRNGCHDRIHADANWYKPQYVEAALP